MAWSAVNYHPCNPLGPVSNGAQIQYPELFNRAAVASMVNSLNFKEDHTIIKSVLSNSLYSGTLDFFRDQTTGLNFKLIASNLLNTIEDRNLAENMHKAYSDIFRGVYDSAYYDQTVSARNQTAHRLPFLRDLYEGFRGQNYAESYNELTRIWGRRFVDTFHSSGFAPESAAIDATYNAVSYTHLTLPTICSV